MNQNIFKTLICSMLFLGFSSLSAMAQTTAVQIPFEKPVLPVELLDEKCGAEGCYAKGTSPTYDGCRFYPAPDQTLVLGCNLGWSQQPSGKGWVSQVFGLVFDKQGKLVQSHLLPLDEKILRPSFMGAFSGDQWVLIHEYKDQMFLSLINVPTPKNSLNMFWSGVSEILLNRADHSFLTMDDWFYGFKLQSVDFNPLSPDSPAKSNWVYETNLDRDLKVQISIGPDSMTYDSSLHLAARPDGGAVVYGLKIWQPLEIANEEEEEQGSLITCVDRQGKQLSSFLLPNVGEEYLRVKNDNSLLLIAEKYDDSKEAYDWELLSLDKNCDKTSLKTIAKLAFPENIPNAVGSISVKGLLTRNNRNYILYTQQAESGKSCFPVDECTDAEWTDAYIQSLPSLYVMETDENGVMVKNHTIISPQDPNRSFLDNPDTPEPVDFDWAFTNDGQSIIMMILFPYAFDTIVYPDDVPQQPVEKELQPSALLIYRLPINASE